MSRNSILSISQLSRALFILAGVLLVLHFAVYVYYAIGLMQFPFDYDQGEGFELVDTIMFSEGEWPYQDTESYPFYASNYPPLFHVILVPFVWIFGEAYWYGRLVGFLGTLVTAAAIGFVVQRGGRDRRVAFLAGFAFLASNYVYHIGPLFRQHMTMVMFETLSVAVLAHASAIPQRGRRRAMLALGLGLLLAAGYTKQLALATAIAIFIFLFIRNPRRSLVWGVLAGAVGGAFFLWIDYSTGGAWWTNIIAANVNDYYPAQFWGLFRQWLRLHGVLIVLATLYVIYELYFARLSIYSVWWVFAVANSTLSGKWGAGDSYFATAIAATCVLSGLFAARTLRGEWSFADNYLSRRLRLNEFYTARRAVIMRLGAVVLPLIYLVYGLSVVKLPTEGAVFGPLADALDLESTYGDRYAFYDSAGSTQGYAVLGHVPTQQDVDNGWRIVDIVAAGDKPAMSEEAGFSLRAGKDVITNATQLKNLYENDLFDPANLVAAIRDQAFNVVVFRAQFYPPPVLDAVYQAYYPAETILMNGFAYEIWEPGLSLDARAPIVMVLSELRAGESASFDVPLEPDAARLWVAHTLDYLSWETASDQGDTEDDCSRQVFRQDDRLLSATACPSESGSALIFEALEG